MVLYYCWEARLMSGTASSARFTAVDGARPKCDTLSDMIKWPKDCVRAYAARMREPHNWWPEFLSLYWDCAGELPVTFLQQLAKRQPAASDFPQPKPKSQVGGILFLASVPYATMISSCQETSRTPVTSGR